jgi:hypothetical protein
MTSLLDLPRELRQQILAYAFEDTVEKDIRLNMYLRFYILPGYYINDTPDWFEKLLLQDQGRAIDDWSCVDIAKLHTFAPNIQKLASATSRLDPQLREDLTFVLKEHLIKLEQGLQLLVADCPRPLGEEIFYGGETIETNLGGPLWIGWWKKNILRGCRVPWLGPVERT